MSNVNVSHIYRGKTTFYRTVGEARLSTISRAARVVLEGQDTCLKRIAFVGGAPAAFHHVLKEALKYGEKVRISIYDQPFAKVVAILEVINALDLEPAQPHVEGHIVYYIAKKTLVPSDLSIIQNAFGHLGEANKPWRTMVYQIAWEAINLEHYSQPDINELAKEARNHPALDRAIQAKFMELLERKQVALAREAAEKRAEEEKQRVREEKRERAKTQIGDSKRQQRAQEAQGRRNEGFAQRMWQERNGAPYHATQRRVLDGTREARREGRLEKSWEGPSCWRDWRRGRRGVGIEGSGGSE